MCAAVALFPDTIVRPAPQPADRPAEARDAARLLELERAASMHELVRRLDHGAVDIELQLVVRRIADAHGPGAPVAFEVRQMLFLQVRIAEDVVEHVQTGPAQTRRMQQPVEEELRFVRIAQVEEGAKGPAPRHAASSSGSPSCARRRLPPAARSSRPPRRRLTARSAAASARARCVRRRCGTRPRARRRCTSPATTARSAACAAAPHPRAAARSRRRGAYTRATRRSSRPQ